MLDLGWTELLVIGIVALIVVGPKDLPIMFRTLGRYTGRLRSMARDFTRAMEEAADESGVRDVAKDLRKATNPKAMGLDALKNAVDFDEIDPFDEKMKSGTPAAIRKKPDPSAPQTPAPHTESVEEAPKIGTSAGAAVAGLDATAAARSAPEAADTPPATDTSKT